MSHQIETKPIHFSQVNFDDITCESVKMGQDKVPLFKYQGNKLYFEGPWIKMKQYGFPPGETLGNGQPNDYYVGAGGEAGRNSFKLPLHRDCNVTYKVKDNEKNSAEEIIQFADFLQKLDEHITNNKKILEEAGISSKNVSKYNENFKKWDPAEHPKKNSKGDEKIKYDSVKTKLNLDKDKKITTEFYIYNEETKKYSLTDKNNVIELEKLIGYNSEVRPVIQLVKIWKQPTGAWGTTLKLINLRAKNTSSNKSKVKIGFADDDDEESQIEVVSKKVANTHIDDDEEESSVESPKKPVAKSNKKASDDEESDAEEFKPVAKDNKRKIQEVASSEDEEEKEAPVVKPTSAKKIQEVESSGEDEEEDENVKPKSKSKPVAAKAPAKKPSSRK